MAILKNTKKNDLFKCHYRGIALVCTPGYPIPFPVVSNISVTQPSGWLITVDGISLNTSGGKCAAPPFCDVSYMLCDICIQVLCLWSSWDSLSVTNTIFLYIRRVVPGLHLLKVCLDRVYLEHWIGLSQNQKFSVDLITVDSSTPTALISSSLTGGRLHTAGWPGCPGRDALQSSQ